MHDLIDTYIKLLTSIITLVVPLLIFFINHVSEARKIKNLKYEQKIKDLQQNSQLDNFNPQNFAKQVTDLHGQIAKIEVQKLKDFKSLTPLRQIIRIYAPLIAAFLLIVIDLAVRNNVINYNHNLSVTLISLSLILFLISCLIIFSIAIVAIKSKEEIENRS